MITQPNTSTQTQTDDINMNSTTNSTQTQGFPGIPRRLREHQTRSQNLIQHPGILDRFLNRQRTTNIRRLEDLVDIQQNTDIGSNSRIDSLNPRQLYNIGWLSSERTSLYRYRRIEDLSNKMKSYKYLIIKTYTCRLHGHFYLSHNNDNNDNYSKCY